MDARESGSGGAGGTAARTAATTVGVALGAGFASLAAVRRPHPIHPHGVLLHGTLLRTGSALRTGIPWIDDADARPVPVLARRSRSVGVPAPLPDVEGLAIRFDGPEGLADLELASTGRAWPGRFLLRAHRSPSHAHLCSLLPYRSPSGPVLLAAQTRAPDDLPASPRALADRLAREPWQLRLLVARPRGTWHAFAELELQRERGPLDPLLRFDAVRHPLPGTAQYDWVRRVRAPAYERVQGDLRAERGPARGAPKR